MAVLGGASCVELSTEGEALALGEAPVALAQRAPDPRPLLSFTPCTCRLEIYYRERRI